MKELYNILERLNPWWNDPDWYKDDEDIKNVRKSRVRHRRLEKVIKEKWLKPVLERRGCVVRVLRGPRRIGKTTLMKLSVLNAIRIGYNPKAITYMTLDNERLKRIIEREGLGEILREIITKSLDEYGHCLIILDEATFYREWALSIKNVVDEGIVREGVLIIVTGSYSLELETSKSLLEGRTGLLPGDSIYQRFVYPLRFIEVAENLSEDIYNYLHNSSFTGKHKLIHKGERLSVIEALAEPGNDKVYEFIERVWDQIGESLEKNFKVYIRVGGFPKVISNYMRDGRIDDSEYVTFYNLLVSDASKFNLDSTILKRILYSKMLKPIVIGDISHFQIEIEGTKGGIRTLRVEEAKKYLDYLIDGSRVLIKLDSIKPRSESSVIGQLLDRDASHPFKLVFTDPFMFYSILWVSLGHTVNIFEAVERMIDEGESGKNERYRQLYALLHEAIACSHVARITLLKYGEDIRNYGRGFREGVEYADCVVWYYDNYKQRIEIIPVEATLTPREDIKRKAEITFKLFRRRLIVASLPHDGPKLLKWNEYEAIIVPTPLLLMFI